MGLSFTKFIIGDVKGLANFLICGVCGFGALQVEGALRIASLIPHPDTSGVNAVLSLWG